MSYDENFARIFITRYNTARPAVMSDVHFRHKMFSILDVPIFAHKGKNKGKYITVELKTTEKFSNIKGF